MRDKVSRLGRLVSSTHHSRRERKRGWVTGILPIGVEMIINLFRNGLPNTGDPFQLAKAGAGDGSCRAEMVQQCPLALRPDTCDLVQRRAAKCSGPPGAVRSDREAMRLVTQALKKIEHGVSWVEREWRSPGQKQSLAPGVAVGPFGDRANRNVVNAEPVKNR